MKNKPKYKNLFLMTLPRSGSTLLGQQLGINSRIFHLGETSYWDLLDPGKEICSCGQKNCKFLSKISREIKTKHLARPLLRVWQIIDRRYWPNKKIVEGGVIQSPNFDIDPKSLDYWRKRCPGALEKIINVYRKHTTKNVFLDNTKLFVIGEELSNRKGWGVIILLRDPRGVMSSYKEAGIAKKDFRRAESVLPFCHDFLSSVKKIYTKENALLVKYEDFCSNPKKILTRICNFNGLNFEKDMMELFSSKYEYRGHVIKGNRILKYSKISDIEEDKRWRYVLTKAELQKLYNDKSLVKLYNFFGYLI